MFTTRVCAFNGEKLICEGQPQEMEKLSEGRNVLKAGQVLKVSDKMILSVMLDKADLHLLFIRETGELANDITFPEVKELEVEKIISILSAFYGGKYMGITTKGALLGDFLSIERREEEEDIIGETDQGYTVLASVHDRP